MNDLAISDPFDVSEESLLPDDEIQNMLRYFEVPALPVYDFENDRRPPSVLIHRREAVAALIEAQGNVTNAAILLKTNRARLAGYIRRDSFTQAILDEVQEILVDKAQTVVDNVVGCDDLALAYQASKFVLTQSKHGRSRGYGENKSNISIHAKDSQLNIQWIASDDKDTEYYDPISEHTPKTIEHDEPTDSHTV